jgi:hypothetical protein
MTGRFLQRNNAVAIIRYAARASNRTLLVVIAPPRIKLASTESPGL